MMNPAKLLKLKSAWEGFQTRHPKFVRYLQVVSDGYLQQEAVLEITVRSADGRELKTNMRVLPQDMELLETVRELAGNEKK